jgi:hypothetical protein
MRNWLITTALLCLGLTVACSGGGGSTPPPAPTGQLTIRLGSDSFPGYNQAVVSIEKVDGSADGVNWITLGSVKTTLDLTVLQNGHSAVILPATAVPPTTYTQFRITWATINYASNITLPAYVFPLSASAGQVLTMPTTTIVNGPVTVPVNGNVSAQIMLMGQQLIQFRAGGTYTFQGVGQALNPAACALISGRLTDGTNPVPNAEVFAETVDGSGLATIQRRSVTDATGSYVLDGLATGSLYFVVSQPGLFGTCYAAQAATPVNATAATTYSSNLVFGAPQSPGSLSLTITPGSTATQGTWGELRQTLATGTSGSQNLIVRSQTVVTGLSQDQAGLVGLAPGTYGVTAQRSTAGAAPVMKVGTQVPVSAGGTATTTLAYP